MLTTFSTQEMLDHMFRNAAFTSPTTVYAGLWTAITDKEAGTGTEATYTGYARVAITFGAPAAAEGGQRCQNSSAVTFGQNTATVETMLAVPIFDATTGGNTLAVIELGGIGVLATAANTGDLFSAFAHGFSVDDRVNLENIPSGAFPAGASENVRYFVGTVPSVDTLTLSTSAANANPLVLSGDGACLVKPQNGVLVSVNDTPEFAVNQLSIVLD